MNHAAKTALTGVLLFVVMLGITADSSAQLLRRRCEVSCAPRRPLLRLRGTRRQCHRPARRCNCCPTATRETRSDTHYCLLEQLGGGQQGGSMYCFYDAVSCPSGDQIGHAEVCGEAVDPDCDDCSCGTGNSACHSISRKAGRRKLAFGLSDINRKPFFYDIADFDKGLTKALSKDDIKVYTDKQVELTYARVSDPDAESGDRLVQLIWVHVGGLRKFGFGFEIKEGEHQGDKIDESFDVDFERIEAIDDEGKKKKLHAGVVRVKKKMAPRYKNYVIVVKKKKQAD